MFPVAISHNLRGDLLSRWLITKSSSLVTTTHDSASASKLMSISAVELPFGKSNVCRASCLRLANSKARPRGSCASTRNFMPPTRRSAWSGSFWQRRPELLSNHLLPNRDNQPKNCSLVVGPLSISKINSTG